MNIFLVPFTWARHVSTSLIVGGAALVTWWVVLIFEVVVGPALGLLWSQSLDGAVFLGAGAGVIGATSVLVESSLRRQALYVRVLSAGVAGVLSMVLAMAFYGAIQLLHPMLVSEGRKALLADPSYVSLRFRLCQWGWAGLASGVGPFAVRIVAHRKLSLSSAWSHVAGGISAAALGAAVWHILGYYGIAWLGVAPDLYLASAFGMLTWGWVHGLLAWGVPPELYAGWIRVLSPQRYGHRIPIDRIDARASERFFGHFPRGLDMFLPADRGVAELHASFVTDGQHGYALRGLSQQPTVLKRFLERVDLRYDPRRPAPLETDLHTEDRIFLGAGDNQTELEFILIPKEER
jgi:hypothetical protein